MPLETVTHISDLVATNPTSSDAKSQGDDHLRNIKIALKNAFPGFTGSVLVGGTTGGSSTAYTLTPTTAMPAWVEGTMIVCEFHTANTTTTPTLNISGLGAKTIVSCSGAALATSDLASSRYTALVYDGTNLQLLAVTKNYVDQLSFSSVLPAQAGNDGKVITTDGSTASWTDSLKATVMRWVDGADITKKLALSLTGITTATTRTLTVPNYDGTIATLAGAETLTNKSLQDSTTYIVDESDATKKAQFQASGITTATTRTITLPDKSGTMAMTSDITSGLVLISTATASNSATVDFTGLSSTYDEYLIELLNVIPATDGQVIYMRTSTNGGSSYDAGASDYKYAIQAHTSANAAANDGGTGTEIRLTNNGLGSDVNEVGASFSIRVIRPSVAQYCQIHWVGGYVTDAGLIVTAQGTAQRQSAADVDAIRFLIGSGNIESGEFKLYGLRKTV